MKNRILAWVLLAGFVFLIVNLTFLLWFPQVSVGIYAIVLICFLYMQNGKKRNS